ncbi:Concanavalin A-like lectin/glucanases superfamily [Pseudocohnilembus persalinus]|uniref:Concanavalin A-like lectin/glucanases superfamily n=1 Tax=Pseudocohnilembus persalinus TaxID=266149 RepID=A0A0V0R3H0_PSEPJ|nr:Concanavalin A-like lectin/glucanases superfamily [Pseudocohnilembus persalinus]|eukprot:KRX08906.1 Concanavalin A-like lectin/glucanases superfamily [Pseudocohnilembus persalinus]
MNQNISNIKIPYLQCPHQGLHYGEELNFLCITGECPENGLICSICRAQKHKDHKIIQLKKFLVDINYSFTQQEKKQKFNIEDLLENIEVMQQENLYTLKKFVENISEKIKNLEESLHSTYKTIIEGEFKDFSVYNQQCKQIIDTIKITPNNTIEFDYDPEKQINKFKYLQKNFLNQAEILKTEFTSQINNIISQIDKTKNLDDQQQYQHLNINQNTYSTKIQTPFLKFNQTLAPKQITVNFKQNQATQTSSTNQDKRIALLEPALNKTGKSYFAFFIKKFVNWVGIGISQKQTLQNCDFKFKYQSLGHGSYFVSANGFTWSTSIKEQNAANLGFKFKQNDIILCELDIEQKKFTILSHYNPKDQFCFENIEIPTNDTLHASVNICNAGEAVEIIEWNPEFSKHFQSFLQQKKQPIKQSINNPKIIDNYNYLKDDAYDYWSDLDVADQFFNK